MTKIKITVIAAGFPEGVNRGGKTLFHPEPADDKGKIFNTITPPSAAPKEAVAPKVEEKKLLDDTDDDWGAVPAFLRRAKK